MAPTLLLDSVILIDHFSGIPPASAYLRQAHGGAAVSVITRAEVLSGFRDSPRGTAETLLDRFPTLPIDREAADLAAALWRKHRWKLPDAFQAALAQIHNLKLVTRNTRDFPPRRYGFVVVPYAVS